MTIMGKTSVIAIAILFASAMANATDVTLHLKGSQAMSRSTVQYECDARGCQNGTSLRPVFGGISERRGK